VFIEFIKLAIYIILIIIISKYMLVKLLRNIAETLNLKAKTVGNIAGFATSIPELFTVTLASISGLASTSLYNIISSNVINLIQYLATVVINKNTKVLKNKALIIDLVIVLITIAIPLYMINANVKLGVPFAIFLVILFLFFYKINSNAHKLYLEKYDKEIEEEFELEYEKEIKNKKNNKLLIVKYLIYLIIIGILLYFVGDKLSNNLENLCYIFNVPEYIIGIILGFGTSIPELITFFEAQRGEKNKEEEKLGVIEATNNLLMSNMLNLFIIQAIGILLISIIKTKISNIKTIYLI